MGANGKVVLPPEAQSEAWTQAEINLFRSSNGFVRPKRGDAAAAAAAEKPKKPMTPRQKAALRAAEAAAAGAAPPAAVAPPKPPAAPAPAPAVAPPAPKPAPAPAPAPAPKPAPAAAPPPLVINPSGQGAQLAPSSPLNGGAAAAMNGGAATRVVRLRGPAAKVAEVSKLLEQMVGLIDGVEIEFVAQ